MSEYLPITEEIKLFVLFHELDRLSYLLRSRLDNGIIPEVSVKHIQAVIKELGRKRDWAFTQLPQFGVDPFKTTGETITEEYRAWYKWWKDYLSTLSEDLRMKILEGSGVSSETVLVPSGTWRDLIGRC
jgi:hypothetical protein